MDFKLNELGSRKFVSTKAVKRPWNKDLSILEVTDSHFTFSEELCTQLGIVDNNVLTFFDKGEEGLYIANITNQIKTIGHPKHICLDDSTIFTIDTLLPSIQKSNVKVDGISYYKARRASRKQLLKVFLEKMGGELGEYQSGGITAAPFPCVKLIAINNIKITSPEAEEVEVKEVESSTPIATEITEASVKLAKEVTGTNSIW